MPHLVFIESAFVLPFIIFLLGSFLVRVIIHISHIMFREVGGRRKKSLYYEFALLARSLTLEPLSTDTEEDERKCT
jgi:hypothetical protein